MPFTPSAEILDRSLDAAMVGQEIKDKLDPLEWSKDEVTAFIAGRESEIWSEVGPQISAFSDAEKSEMTAKINHGELLLRRPFVSKLYEDYLPGAFGFGILFLAIVGLTAEFYPAERAWLMQLYRIFLLFLAERKIRVWSLLGLLPVAGFFAWTYWRLKRETLRSYEANRTQKKELVTQAGEEKLRLEGLIEPAIVTSITRHLREFVEQKTKPVFSLELLETDTSRLSEVPDPQFDVITDGRRYVRGLLEKMVGGSIGVAGPRGCGKTTLLRSFCPEGNVDPRMLTIFATAPVQYDPREFLLQLFTSVCSRVMAKEMKTDAQSMWTEMDSLRATSAPPIVSAETVTSILAMGSFFLIALGLILGSVRVTQAQHRRTVAAATAAVAAGGAAKAPAAPLPPEESAWWIVLDSDALPYLLWGGLALALGTVMRSQTSSASFNRVLGFYSLRKRHDDDRYHASIEGLSTEAKELVKRARRTLQALRFQQSYSSGWSGALKLPMGLEGGANAAMTFAERQLGLPEIVNEYREFTRAAAAYYDRVYIAIDEMDKLPSDEDAKKFMNGIKAIFGQEKIYYLVSISENAMSNFERRGLPIRDEFDSSFDDAVHLGYFDLMSSRRLLARRSSVPPPAPYRAYCHVASGGLPRDLIRSCRKMYDYRRMVTGPIDIAAMCTALIGRDIEAKLSAIRYNLQRVPDERETVSVLALMAPREWTRPALEDVIYKLHAAQSRLAESAKKKAGLEAEDATALVNILEELKAYLYFSLATTSIFESIKSEERYDELEETKVFDRLAMARQMMAVNRLAAIEALHVLVPLPLA